MQNVKYISQKFLQNFNYTIWYNTIIHGTTTYLPNPEKSEISSADEETNSDVEYESTESEYLDGSDNEENSANERDLSPESHIATSLKTKETEPNIDNFRWRKRKPRPVQSLFKVRVFGASSRKKEST